MQIKKVKPGKGQESVWDYPRPPKLEAFKGSIRIQFNDEVILETDQGLRVLETSHPPTYYFPKNSFKEGIFKPNPHSSYCEYKGIAGYFDIVVKGKTAKKAAWYYPNPTAPYKDLKDHVCIYAHLMDACYLNDERVKAQEGDFYGGWITSNIVGPFKGGAGTWGW